MQCKKCGVPMTASVGAWPPLVAPNAYPGAPLEWPDIGDVRSVCLHEVDREQELAEAMRMIAATLPATAHYRSEALGCGVVRHYLVLDQSATSVGEAIAAQAALDAFG